VARTGAAGAGSQRGAEALVELPQPDQALLGGAGAEDHLAQPQGVRDVLGDVAAGPAERAGGLPVLPAPEERDRPAGGEDQREHRRRRGAGGGEGQGDRRDGEHHGAEGGGDGVGEEHLDPVHVPHGDVQHARRAARVGHGRRLRQQAPHHVDPQLAQEAEGGQVPGELLEIAQHPRDQGEREQGGDHAGHGQVGGIVER
jgi:hypothetical protein